MSWTLIEHQALTSSVASVTLGSGGSLPQTYKTLKLVVSARTTSNASGSLWAGLLVKPNNDTTSQLRVLYGNGSTAASYASNPSSVSAWATTSSATASTFSNVEVVIPNYSGSIKKPISTDVVTENNAATALQALVAQLWDSTAAITSLVIATDGTAGDLASGSTFTLYGLA